MISAFYYGGKGTAGILNIEVLQHWIFNIQYFIFNEKGPQELHGGLYFSN
jgi:hypothetical protein